MGGSEGSSPFTCQETLKNVLFPSFPPVFPFLTSQQLCFVSNIPNEKTFCIPLGETDYLVFMLGDSGGLRVW